MLGAKAPTAQNVGRKKNPQMLASDTVQIKYEAAPAARRE